MSSYSIEYIFFFECLVISFIYLFLAVLGLPCYAGFSLAVASGLLTAAASLVASTGPRAHRLPQLQHTDSVLVMYWLSCSGLH